MDEQEALTTECRLLRAEFEAAPESTQVSKDIGDFLEALLAYVRRVMPVDVLDEKASKVGLLSVEAVRAFTDSLRDAGADSWRLVFADGSANTGAELLRDVYSELDAFDLVQKNHGTDEASVRLVMRGSRDLERLLYAAAQADAAAQTDAADSDVAVDLAASEKILRMQLSSYTDSDVDKLWASIQREVAPERTHPLQLEGVFPPEFFGLAAADTLRQRIAEYVVTKKPKAAVQGIGKGRNTVPSELPGIARLLASESETQLENDEARTVRALTQLLEAWGASANGDRFAMALGLDIKCWFCRSVEQRIAKGKDSGRSLGRALRVAERLLHYALSYLTLTNPIEKALREYKLGLEVTLPESRDPFERDDERYLQKQLCKFLVERGMRAYGTKIGRQETDILAEWGSGPSFVIEVKRYKTPPSDKQIKRHLAQLQSYIDTEFKGAKGVLFMFNLTDIVFKAPRKWIREQYWVLPVNMSAASPSKRLGSIEVHAGKDGELIQLDRNAVSPGSDDDDEFPAPPAAEPSPPAAAPTPPPPVAKPPKGKK